MTVRVTTAAQAAAMDERAIQGGTASLELMRRAGQAAALVLQSRFALSERHGVTIMTGPGNNGGDGWIVAAALSSVHIACRVIEVAEPRTDDARAAKAEAPPVWQRAMRQLLAVSQTLDFGNDVIVDAVLGTGAHGAPREDFRVAIDAMNLAREKGAKVVSLDLPSGLDANTGIKPGACVQADLTITFGSVKRGLLRNRDVAGAIVAVDIGLGAAADDPSAPALVGASEAFARVPRIPSLAHKGTRRRLLVIGGASGMAGAAILAARGALRSGIGMVKLCVESPSIPPVQSAEPAVLTTPWPLDAAALAASLDWCDAVLLGPGLGLGRVSRELADRVLSTWRGPIVVDADALTLFDENAQRLGEFLGGRPAVITPHALEAQRLAGIAAADLDAGRFEAADRLADRVKATVLLKGVPTVISNGTVTQVVATGTAVLATGGSGDVLGGIVATLLAQTGDPMASATSAAWVHGRASEIAGNGAVRGVALEDVVEALRGAWRRPARLPNGLLADLPAAPE